VVQEGQEEDGLIFETERAKKLKLTDVNDDYIKILPAKY
jgi:hypothetical protein